MSGVSAPALSVHPIEPAQARSQLAWEAVIIAALMLIGFSVGRAALAAFIRSGEKPAFYQVEFSPAVAVACGRGYQNIDRESVRPLNDFLTLRTGRFTCADLPASPATRPLNTFQAISRYLQTMVALVWMLAGISWRALDVVLALAYGFVAVLAFALCRLALGRVMSAAVALAIVFSPVHLVNLPHLRDYAKAPFILALLVVMGLLVVRPRTRRTTVALSAAGGVVLGVGLGFRNDLLVTLVPMAIVIGLVSAVDHPRPMRVRATAFAAFLLSFAAAGYPILRAYSESSNTGHVALLGLMTPFDAALNIRASIYEVGDAYSDAYAALMVRGSVERSRPAADLQLSSPAYDRATNAYLRTIVRTFPADLAVRACGSILRVLELPYMRVTEPPAWLTGPLRSGVQWQIRILARLKRLVLPAVVVLVPVVLAVRPRFGLWLLLLVGWFGGTGAVQFGERHLFYLEILPVGAAAAAVALIVAVAGRLFQAGHDDLGAIVPRGWRVHLVRALLAAVLLFAGGAGGLAILRAVQVPRVTALLTAYEAAPRVADPVQAEAIDARRSRIPVPAPPQRSWPRSMTSTVFEFGGDACPVGAVTAVFRYRTPYPSLDFSRRTRIPLPRPPASMLFFLPIFRLEGQVLEFSGLELPTAEVPCLRSLSHVTDDSRLEIPLIASLDPAWRAKPLYQRLAWPGRRVSPVDRGDAGVPDAVERQLERRDFSFVAEGVSVGRRATRIDVVSREPYSYLLVSHVRTTSPRSYAVAAGVLQRGGLTVGVLKDGVWAASVNVVEPGRFRVVVPLDSGGDVQLAVANYLASGERRNEAVLSAVGWGER